MPVTPGPTQATTSGTTRQPALAGCGGWLRRRMAGRTQALGGAATPPCPGGSAPSAGRYFSHCRRSIATHQCMLWACCRPHEPKGRHTAAPDNLPCPSGEDPNPESALLSPPSNGLCCTMMSVPSPLPTPLPSPSPLPVPSPRPSLPAASSPSPSAAPSQSPAVAAPKLRITTVEFKCDAACYLCTVYLSTSIAKGYTACMHSPLATILWANCKLLLC
ncbi:hypothetical protein COO60DRAFT_1699729 [Scenedesmus sp. NREL 46B-D3]|nr:hypothetical protein COO60DRAFT_1699729 [Scenedesmus sp. NREL 46B-D3]